MHCNLRPPEPRQSFSALITTPCQVWSRWTYPLPYYSVFDDDILLYAVTLTFDIWPWTFDVSPVMWWNSLPNLNAIEQSAAEILRFQCWPYDFEHCVTCCARHCDKFHQVLPSTTYPFLNYSVFWCWYVMSRCNLDFWLDALESSCYIKRHVIKVSTKFERNRPINGWIIDNFANFCTRCHAVTLTFDPLTLNFCSTSGVMRLYSVKNLSEINRIIHQRVSDDLSRFRVHWQTVVRGVYQNSPNFPRT